MRTMCAIRRKILRKSKLMNEKMEAMITHFGVDFKQLDRCKIHIVIRKMFGRLKKKKGSFFQSITSLQKNSAKVGI